MADDYRIITLECTILFSILGLVFVYVMSKVFEICKSVAVEFRYSDLN